MHWHDRPQPRAQGRERCLSAKAESKLSTKLRFLKGENQVLPGQDLQEPCLPCLMNCIEASSNSCREHSLSPHPPASQTEALPSLLCKLGHLLPRVQPSSKGWFHVGISFPEALLARATSWALMQTTHFLSGFMSKDPSIPPSGFLPSYPSISQGLDLCPLSYLTGSWIHPSLVSKAQCFPNCLRLRPLNR